MRGPCFYTEDCPTCILQTVSLDPKDMSTVQKAVYEVEKWRGQEQIDQATNADLAEWAGEEASVNATFTVDKPIVLSSVIAMLRAREYCSRPEKEENVKVLAN